MQVNAEYAMQTQHLDSHTITETEVAEWWGKTKRLTNAEYAAIAAKLSRMWWPGDPPPDAPLLPKDAEDEVDLYWNFQAVHLAAQTLSSSLPAMKAHWSRLRTHPETRGGYNAIGALETALRDAAHFIEFPFGEPEKPNDGSKTPKPWHLSSVLIANSIITTLIAAGRPVGGITRNSVIVRVIEKALVRMGYPDPSMRSPSAIGAYLTRWHEKYGLAHWKSADDHKAVEDAL